MEYSSTSHLSTPPVTKREYLSASASNINRYQSSSSVFPGTSSPRTSAVFAPPVEKTKDDIVDYTFDKIPSQSLIPSRPFSELKDSGLMTVTVILPDSTPYKNMYTLGEIENVQELLRAIHESSKMKGIWEDYEMFEVRLDGVGTLFHHRSTQNVETLCR